MVTRRELPDGEAPELIPCRQAPPQRASKVLRQQAPRGDLHGGGPANP
jgi:hypothetical protein